MKRPFLNSSVNDSVNPMRIQVVETIMLVMTANCGSVMVWLTSVRYAP